METELSQMLGAAARRRLLCVADVCEFRVKRLAVSRCLPTLVPFAVASCATEAEFSEPFAVSSWQLSVHHCRTLIYRQRPMKQGAFLTPLKRSRSDRTRGTETEVDNDNMASGIVELGGDL
jgi:hypothetical protein